MSSTLCSALMLYFLSSAKLSNFISRVNLTLNRDDENDEINEIHYKKPIQDHSKVAARKAAFAVRSRSMMGCDQMGIETMVSILNSSEESDVEEKDDFVPIPLPPQRVESSIRLKNNVLRKTGEHEQKLLKFIKSLYSLKTDFTLTVSFQEDNNYIRKDSVDIQKTSNIPFSGRMRHTRSLFGQEICNLYLPNR